MRLITIVSFLVATAHVAVSAPVYSIAPRGQGGVGAVIPVIPFRNGVVQRDYNEEEDIHARQLATLLVREPLCDGPNGLFRRSKGALNSIDDLGDHMNGLRLHGDLPESGIESLDDKHPVGYVEHWDPNTEQWHPSESIQKPAHRPTKPSH
ncbi:hypothetical protein K439DRAFT_1621553 [Ramaria rubella]|nr:hypothetical protein K439DRAFT_1621553 [Ramaria rubella]